MDGHKRRREGRGLSARELEVLAHAARGMRNREVAEALHISEATVKRHLANVYEAMGVHSRGEAVTVAVRSGTLPADLLAGEPWGAAGERYRCAEEGCGCEVAVVVAPPDGADWRPPACHGREMGRFGPPRS